MSYVSFPADFESFKIRGNKCAISHIRKKDLPIINFQVDYYSMDMVFLLF